MKKDPLFLRGKYVVTYDPAEYPRESVLKFLAEFRSKEFSPGQDPGMIRIDFNSKNVNNLYSTEPANEPGKSPAFYLSVKDPGLRFQSGRINGSPLPDIAFDIKSIKLSTPWTGTDIRWDSIGLTSSSIFLGSALSRSGYRVSVENIKMPYAEFPGDFFNSDVTGFTLFEDVFPEFRNFISGTMNTAGNRLIAAGGPFITLSGPGALFFLPRVNLFVRGEAESVFPGLLAAIRAGSIDEMMKYKGFVYQKDGVIVISDFDKINYVRDLSMIDFDLSFADNTCIMNGLEMNFSRGCRNHCVFCSKIQGRTLRKLPPGNIERLLAEFRVKLEESGPGPEGSPTLNINDDDILQDPDYAAMVFKKIIEHQFKIWGIQTSITSLFHDRGKIDMEKINMIADPELYAGKVPLLWIGTDTFLKQRGSRLGKPLPELHLIRELLSVFEELNIRNFHYWISSDHLSTWEEFFEELFIIIDLLTGFPSFSLLPHTPFLIPYPSTPSFRLVSASDSGGTIKYRKILKGVHPVYDLYLVDHAETRSDHLNRLLKNEKLPGREGFFDYLKRRDLRNSLITAYSFLKDERIAMENSGQVERSDSLKRLESEASQFITNVPGDNI